MPRPAPSRLSIVLAAAVATAAVSGFVPSSTAIARPARDATAELRAENRQLREDLRAYQAAYRELQDGLDKLDRAAAKLRDKRDRRQIAKLVDRTRERASRHVISLPNQDDLDDRHDHERAMSDRDFGILLSRLGDESFADDQVGLVRTVSADAWFTVDQVVRLMKAVNFEDTKIEIAVLLYARTVDPNNWYLVYDALTFSSSKASLRQRLGL